MVIGIIIIALALLYGVAEFFGRSKHIGKWWAFSLLATSLIGGIIAIAVSPSAKNDPTKPKPSFKTWGWVCIVFGALNILVLNPLAIGFFLLGVYLFELSKGNIVNSDPKYYFDQISKPVAKSSYNSVKSAPNKPIFNRKSNPAPLDSTQKYFIIENDKQSQPFSIEELKSKEIKEDTFVWRKGLEDWVKAKDLPEIEDIIFYQPPPFVPKEDIEEKQEETPPEIPVKTEPTYHIENFDYTLGDIEKAIKNHKYFDRNTIVKLPDGRESKFQEIPEFWNFIDDYYPPEIGKKKTLAENEHSIKAKENKKEKRNGLIIVIVSIIVIFSILIGASLFHNSYRPTQKTNSSKTETTKKKDFSNEIRRLIRAEDNRDLSLILDFFDDRVVRYWNLYTPTKDEIEAEYRKAWRYSSYSSNNILEIHKTNELEYILKTKFTFKDRKSKKYETVNNRVYFLFDEKGKVLKTYGLGNSKVFTNEPPINKAKKKIYYGNYLYKTKINSSYSMALRIQPNANSNKIYEVPPNSEIYVITTSEDIYYKVWVNGHTGYFSKHYLQ